ncbi:hypothetical protein, partial [Deinococcus saxicola]
THPPLTTLRVDKEALGVRGVQMLLDRSAQSNIELPAELIVRASSGGTVAHAGHARSPRASR